MTDDVVRVLIEIPKGSRNKYERDPETGEIELDRRLAAAATYPTEYGFVKETVAEDGDELDALVAVTEPTFPGCVIRTKPLAVLRLRTDAGIELKVFGVPLADPSWSGFEEAQDIPGDLVQEIEHFFESFSALEGKHWKVDSWGDSGEALQEIETARQRFRDQDG